MSHIDTDDSEIERPFEVSLPSKDSRMPGIKFKINFNVDKNGKVWTTGTKNRYIFNPALSGNETITHENIASDYM